MKKFLLLLILAFALIACGDKKAEDPHAGHDHSGHDHSEEVSHSDTKTKAESKQAVTRQDAAKQQTKQEARSKMETKSGSGEIVTLTTKFGDIKIKLYDETPKHRDNFLKHVNSGFYNGTTFHRVIPNFMIQGGDPNTKDKSSDKSTHGTGGPGYTVPAEINPNLKHYRGAVAAARLGDQVNPKKESSGSQFYIAVADIHFLDNNYTVFGEVIEGMEVADKIVNQKRDQRDNPLERTEMTIKAAK